MNKIYVKNKMSKKSALQLLDELIGELEILVVPAPTGNDIPIVLEIKPVVEPSAQKVGKNAGGDKEKKAKKTSAASTGDAGGAEAEAAELTVNSLDLRVGVITKVARHETADKLYCEEIDVGEDAPRPIASGLVPHYTLEEMQGRRLIVVCNLKPRSLVGFKSNGMVLCAAKVDSNGVEKVEFIDPPADAKPGDRVFGLTLGEGGAFSEASSVSPPLSQKQCDKRKVFEVVAESLRVDSNGVATWKDMQLVVALASSAEPSAAPLFTPCTAPTVRDACIR